MQPPIPNTIETYRLTDAELVLHEVKRGAQTRVVTLRGMVKSADSETAKWFVVELDERELSFVLHHLRAAGLAEIPAADPSKESAS